MSSHPHELSVDDTTFAKEEEPALGMELRDLSLVQTLPLTNKLCVLWGVWGLGTGHRRSDARYSLCGLLWGLPRSSVGRRASNWSRAEWFFQKKEGSVSIAFIFKFYCGLFTST